TVAEIPLVRRRGDAAGAEGGEDELVRQERAADDARLDGEVEGALDRLAVVADLDRGRVRHRRRTVAHGQLDVVLAGAGVGVLHARPGKRSAAVAEVPLKQRRAGEVEAEG